MIRLTLSLLLAALSFHQLCFGQLAFRCCSSISCSGCSENVSCPSGTIGCVTQLINGDVKKRGCTSQELVDCYKQQGLFPEPDKCVDAHFSPEQDRRFRECERNIGGDQRIYIVQEIPDDYFEDQNQDGEKRKAARAMDPSKRRRRKRDTSNDDDKAPTPSVPTSKKGDGQQIAHRVCFCKDSLCNTNGTRSLHSKTEILQVLLFALGVILIRNQ